MIETSNPGWSEEELKAWIAEAKVRPFDALAYFQFVLDTVEMFNQKTIQAGIVPTTTLLQHGLHDAIKKLKAMQ